MVEAQHTLHQGEEEEMRREEERGKKKHERRKKKKGEEKKTEEERWPAAHVVVRMEGGPILPAPLGRYYRLVHNITKSTTREGGGPVPPGGYLHWALPGGSGLGTAEPSQANGCADAMAGTSGRYI
jgi:hypothetical protein